jgi:hypothetical protein
MRSALSLIIVLAGCSRSDPGGAVRDSIATLPTQQAQPPGGSHASSVMLQPVDQADSSFSAFREELLAALERRDTAFLYSILSPDIKNSFGGDDSIAGFRRMWKPQEPNSMVWTALTRALEQGGDMKGNRFVFPYVYASWPDDVDAFQHVAITAENAPAYAEPNESSAMLTRLSHEIVAFENWQGLGEMGVPTRSSWAQVKLPDGRTAWVNGLHAYSPVSWRGSFERRGDRWVLTLFVAGD